MAVRIEDLANPRWRVNHLYKIVDKNSKQITFQENKIQKIINNSKSKRNLIIKPRQVGASTNEIIKNLDFTCFNKNVVACTIAHEQDAIKKLFEKVIRAHRGLGPLAPELEKGGGSRYEYRFLNNQSKYYTDLESQGDTIQRLHISEAALMKEERYQVTVDCVPKDGEINIESRPNGITNLFYELWNDKNTPFQKFFFPWYMFPEYTMPKGKLPCADPDDEKDLKKKALKLYNIKITKGQLQYRRYKILEKGLYSFLENFPEDDVTCFLTSGRSAMNLLKVKEMMTNAKPLVKQKGSIKIYNPDKQGIFVIGADTAEGVSHDSSVGVVFNVQTKEQVAVLRGDFTPMEFAHELKKLADFFTNKYPGPQIAVERNNHGHAVLLELKEHIRYPNLYRAKDDRPGWVTDKVTRPIMIDTLIEAIHNKSVKLNDDTTLSECLTLVVKDNGKIEAAAGKHDDCFIASAIGLQLCIENKAHIYNNLMNKVRF